MADPKKLKREVIAEIDSRKDELIHISETIHANPELAFQEFKAVALLASTLEKYGFTIEKGVAGLETAFVATYKGKGEGPVIGLLGEYDALPELGHACGHNIMGTASAGAAIALRAVLDKLPGTIKMIGTPAEEGGAGKVIMAQAGVFDGLDAAMMVHPSTRTLVARRSLACQELKIEFFGKAAHAAASPDNGINALDAVILTFNGINALRQHVRDDVRIHGIITNGGAAPNIVPDYASAEFLVRAADRPYQLEVMERVEECARGAALATGAEVKLTRAPLYYDSMMPNMVLANLFAENLRQLGLEVDEPGERERMGSTDMGNVSHVVPTIQPYIAIAPEEVAGHSVEMREAAVSPAGHAGMLNAARALAMTAVDLLCNPDLVRRAWEEFHNNNQRQ